MKDAENGSEPVTTHGSTSEQVRQSTTLDSGKIRAVNLSSKKTEEPPQEVGWYQAMLNDMREQDELMKRNAKEMRTMLFLIWLTNPLITIRQV